MISVIIWYLTLVVPLFSLKQPPRCLNHKGEHVDWWFIYKVAKDKAANTTDAAKKAAISKGLRYVYFDSKMAKETEPGAQYKFLPVL